MRKKIVAGNWKMNLGLEEGQALASEVVNIAKDELGSDVTLVMCTPFIHLASVGKLVGGNVHLGAQDISNQDKGAFTGQVSAAQLTSVGVKYVLVGHSERREYNNESDELLKEKVDKALAAGLTPVFCCGESLAQRESGEYKTFVPQQITNSLFHLSAADFGKVVLAYEPIWAIGTGVTASAEDAQGTHAIIRKHVESKYGADVADSTSILYGGSCKPSNAKELFASADIDGGLIGGASLASRDFVEIGKSY